MIQTAIAKPPLYYGWYIVATCIFIAFVAYGVRNAFGIFVIPMSEEFGWSRSTISVAAALGFLMSGLAQPILGGVLDRFGSRKVIISSLIVLGVATALLSLTFHLLYLVFFLGVVGSVAISGVSLGNLGALLSKWYQRKRASVAGFMGAGSSLGGLLLVPFGMYLLQAAGWRVTWLVLGLIILVLAAPLAFQMIRNDPGDLGLCPDGDACPDDGDDADDASHQRGPLEVDRWVDSFRSLPIWQMTASFIVCGMTTGILAVHFVPFAIDQGVSAGTAATIFGFMMGLNVVGSIMAGVLSDRFGRKNILALTYFLRGIGYLLLLLVPGGLSLWIFAGVAGFSWIATAPMTTSLTADVYGLRSLGAISGVSFLFHAIGSFISIMFAGFLYDATGSYILPFGIAGALLFPAALSAFSIKEKKYSLRYQPRKVAGVSGG